ncbi:fungal-specific transcription factor domain-containing protein [Aspergillus avenaceus]|uniref:Fungal-specific transcription factor domain-containing protein n=1 Tax=Aspergillus avenaceus TaxID=36643 RepID=A0A5N6TYZ9_ASPAV|nr:fungal-specific transcription factor domain-containing protein [Aspergillus avenaceus]
MVMSQRRVPRACERCRKQKLKCDPRRPCTLCKRSNVECVAIPTGKWKFYCPETPNGGGNDRGQDGNGDVTNDTTSKRPWTAPQGAEKDAGSPGRKRTRRESVLEATTTESPDSVDASWNPSSTMTMVREAFSRHLASSPQGTDTPAFVATPWTQWSNNSPPGNGKAAGLLVNNHFDRIHWFMLLFHQQQSRDKVCDLYTPEPVGPQRSPSSRLGDIAVLLAVLATSLKYTTDLQKSQMRCFNVDPDILNEKILTNLRLRLLDILALGTLEAVQTCVLLGSYYLFHGEPELAWPLCGCGLRIAQALNLHRKFPYHGTVETTLKPSISARKRCWWAVYEIETFCSMLYGFPLSLSDSDCDVDPLDVYDESSASAIQESLPPRTTLLHYKCAMSTLSSIVKSALVDLYSPTRGHGYKGQRIADQASRLTTLLGRVELLSSRLYKWTEDLPAKLKLGKLDAGSAMGYENGFLDESAPGSAQISFEEHLFRLQALTLKLAFENAKILIHRPLLSFKMISRPRSFKQDRSRGRVDPFTSAINTCRDAALQMSLIGKCPSIRQAADSYAAAFMSLHLFTAAVTISNITSLDPLSPSSHECKLGIRRLVEIQKVLKEKSIVASQGLEITKQLMSLAIRKEMSAIFGDTISESELPTRHTDLRDLSPRRTGQGNMSALTAAELPATANTPVEPADFEQSSQFMGNYGEISPDTNPSMLGLGDLEFRENTSLTQALIDFGQVINLPSASNGDDPTLVSGGEYQGSLENCLVGQDQGWIWGWGL